MRGHSTREEYVASARLIWHRGRRPRSAVGGFTNLVCRSGAHAPNCSVTDCDGVPSEYDAVPSYLGEQEVQCIATPETCAGWEFRREDEIAGFVKNFPFSVNWTPCSSRGQAKKSCIITQSPGPDTPRVDRSTPLFLTLCVVVPCHS